MRRVLGTEEIAPAVLDLALAAMAEHGVTPDVRRIRRVPGGGVEFDLTTPDGDL